MSSVFDFKVKTIDGKEKTLEEFKGKALLIVNTASQCGFTPQYSGLEKMYKKHQNDLVVLAFPCNQFGAQEPGDATEIKKFCSLNYETSFPLFAKVDVNGDQAHPLFQYLKKELPGLLGTEKIKWNFTKFLVDKKGVPIKRFAPQDEPASIEKEILELM